MRSNKTRFGLTALAGGAIALSLTASAMAGSRHRDHVYADSFGNLVIESAAGYKRILVGEGAQAKALADYTSAGQNEPDIVYLDDQADKTVARSDCYRPPVLVKGRSYMYGFSEGEIPQISPCQ